MGLPSQFEINLNTQKFRYINRIYLDTVYTYIFKLSMFFLLLKNHELGLFYINGNLLAINQSTICLLIAPVLGSAKDCVFHILVLS